MTEATVLGTLSMIFWALVLTVTVKYVTFVMRADNNGEGGILTMMVLAQRVCRRPQVAGGVVLIAILGACLFFGDGMITPAISVLSAIEGLEVTSPLFKPAVLPALGARHRPALRLPVSRHRLDRPRLRPDHGDLVPRDRRARPASRSCVTPRCCAPSRRAMWWSSPCITAATTFITLGSVVLAVTGAEALYADMGHFGRKPIQRAWTFFVLPCLALNYFGQGALILQNPDTLAQSRSSCSARLWLRLPMVLLATAATVIASQAMISGAYSVARQCVQLGFIPRMIVRHTSETEEGQIYVPQINTMLLIGVLVLVLVLQEQRGPRLGLWRGGDRHLHLHHAARRPRLPAPVQLVAHRGRLCLRLLPGPRPRLLHLQPDQGAGRRLGTDRGRRSC